MRRDLRFEVVYPYPPERVLRALTNRDELAQWPMPNDFKAEQGHKFRFHDKPRPGFDGTVECEVVKVEEPHRLTYRWVSGTLNTVVCFQLAPSRNLTRTYPGVAGSRNSCSKHKLNNPAGQYEHRKQNNSDHRCQPWHRPGTRRRSTQTKGAKSVCRNSWPTATL